MVRNVLPEGTLRRVGFLSVVVALALPAWGAASAGTPDGSNTPAKSIVVDAGTTGCVDASSSVRRAATAPGDGWPIVSVPGPGAAPRKVATPVETAGVASVPAFGSDVQVAVRGTAKTAFGGMRAAGAASASDVVPCG
jgi:hypothetical protein